MIVRFKKFYAKYKNYFRVDLFFYIFMFVTLFILFVVIGFD